MMYSSRSISTLLDHWPLQSSPIWWLVLFYALSPVILRPAPMSSEHPLVETDSRSDASEFMDAAVDSCWLQHILLRRAHDEFDVMRCMSFTLRKAYKMFWKAHNRLIHLHIALLRMMDEDRRAIYADWILELCRQAPLLERLKARSYLVSSFYSVLNINALANMCEAGSKTR